MKGAYRHDSSFMFPQPPSFSFKNRRSCTQYQYWYWVPTKVSVKLLDTYIMYGSHNHTRLRV